MRAIVQDTFGGIEVLRPADVPEPAPLPTEVVVLVKAIGINPVETYIRAGRFPFAGQPPIILGWDISGIVESVVPGTNRFAPGDEVFGMPLFPRAAEAYAELVAAPSRQLARKTDGMAMPDRRCRREGGRPGAGPGCGRRGRPSGRADRQGQGRLCDRH